MAKRSKKHEEEGGEAWLLPYSDLMTLLLAVFIVLFAVSKVDAGKAQALALAFTDQLMVASEGNGAGSGGEMPGAQLSASSADVENPAFSASSALSSSVTQQQVEQFMGQYELQSLTDLKTQVDAKLDAAGISASVTTSIDMRGLVVSLDNALFFDSGSADIKPENADALVQVAQTVSSLNNYIRIEGHTDNVPIHSSLYPSNWELSSARAANVVQLFINYGGISPYNLESVGYGEYRPAADNSTAEGRARNRCIDIIVLSSRYNYLEGDISVNPVTGTDQATAAGSDAG